MRNPALKLTSALLFCVPLSALAHPGHGGSGFFDGFAHPFLGADHLLAMVAIGLWAVLRGRAAWLAPFVFVGGLALGALLGARGAGLPQIEPQLDLLVAVSLTVFGLMLAHPRALAGPAAYAIIAAFAFAHGLAHGGELPQATHVIVGIVAGSALLHALGMAAAMLVLRERPRATHAIGHALACVGGGLVLAALL
jgi:urease accessory protein